MRMKKISCLFLLAMVAAMPANAGNSRRQFVSEVRRGVDVVGAARNINMPDEAPGELGLDVYQSTGVADSAEIRMFIPTDMYMRAGGGIVIDSASSRAEFGDTKHNMNDSYHTFIGLGWNLSSYVRTEIDAQMSTLKFAELGNRQANYQTLNGMLYFDFARRYVQHGDITHMRHFVPFMGLGIGVGHYEFEGAKGANGLVFAAPRAEFGFNFMMTDLIGIDIAYQYQMMIGDGFGWNVSHHGVANISNLVAGFRVNF